MTKMRANSVFLGVLILSRLIHLGHCGPGDEVGHHTGEVVFDNLNVAAEDFIVKKSVGDPDGFQFVSKFGKQVVEVKLDEFTVWSRDGLLQAEEVRVYSDVMGLLSFVLTLVDKERNGHSVFFRTLYSQTLKTGIAETFAGIYISAGLNTAASRVLNFGSAFDYVFAEKETFVVRDAGLRYNVIRPRVFDSFDEVWDGDELVYASPNLKVKKVALTIRSGQKLAMKLHLENKKLMLLKFTDKWQSIKREEFNAIDPKQDDSKIEKIRFGTHCPPNPTEIDIHEDYLCKQIFKKCFVHLGVPGISYEFDALSKVTEGDEVILSNPLKHVKIFLYKGEYSFEMMEIMHDIDRKYASGEGSYTFGHRGNKFITGVNVYFLKQNGSWTQVRQYQFFEHFKAVAAANFERYGQLHQAVEDEQVKVTIRSNNVLVERLRATRLGRISEMKPSSLDEYLASAIFAQSRTSLVGTPIKEALQGGESDTSDQEDGEVSYESGVTSTSSVDSAGLEGMQAKGEEVEGGDESPESQRNRLLLEREQLLLTLQGQLEKEEELLQVKKQEEEKMDLFKKIDEAVSKVDELKKYKEEQEKALLAMTREQLLSRLHEVESEELDKLKMEQEKRAEEAQAKLEEELEQLGAQEQELQNQSQSLEEDEKMIASEEEQALVEHEQLEQELVILQYHEELNEEQQRRAEHTLALQHELQERLASLEERKLQVLKEHELLREQIELKRREIEAKRQLLAQTDHLQALSLEHDPEKSALLGMQQERRRALLKLHEQGAPRTPQEQELLSEKRIVEEQLGGKLREVDRLLHEQRELEELTAHQMEQMELVLSHGQEEELVLQLQEQARQASEQGEQVKAQIGERQREIEGLVQRQEEVDALLQAQHTPAGGEVAEGIKDGVVEGLTAPDTHSSISDGNTDGTPGTAGQQGGLNPLPAANQGEIGKDVGQGALGASGSEGAKEAVEAKAKQAQAGKMTQAGEKVQAGKKASVGGLKAGTIKHAGAVGKAVKGALKGLRASVTLRNKTKEEQDGFVASSMMLMVLLMLIQ